MKQAGNSHIFSFRARLNRLKRDTNRWSVFTLAIVAFIALPIISIGVKLFAGPGETWSHLVDHLLADYIGNTFFLIFFCSLLVLLLGVSSAWLVSRFQFPFRKQMEWLLILPLAIPSYIVAYAYAGIFDYGGSFELLLRFANMEFIRIDMMNKYGLAFVLSISLFPYVYVSSRAFFLNQAGNLLEASTMLGIGEFKSFFKLILPLARPAIIAGLILVLMEVLNDYGAAQYFGVNTFTTGIFRAWFALEEPETAIYLSALLITFVFGLISFEKWQRKNMKVASEKASKYSHRKAFKKPTQWMIFLIVLIPVSFGFFIPLSQLIYWAILTAGNVFDLDFLMLSLQSLWIALVTSVVTVFIATLLIYLAKWSSNHAVKNLSKIGILGYAIPGAVIAIGIMIPTLALDKWIIGLMDKFFGISVGLLFNGSLVALVYAYAVRFMAVAYNPIESTGLKVSSNIPDSSRMLGVGNFETFLRVEFPLIKTGILSAMILVFIDVMKELPLTLILKPFHINTLAVKAFEYASDELIMEAAIPSLFIIFTAAFPVIFLNRLLIKE
ncbi:ABC transporter permease [Salegentibacter sp. F14]